MNPFFILLVIIGMVVLWILLVSCPVGKYIGKYVSDILSGAKENIKSEEDENE